MNINFTFSCIIKKVYTANRIFFVVVLTCFYFEFLFFLMMRGGRIKIPLIAGHLRPASETSFKWRFAGGPIMAYY